MPKDWQEWLQIKQRKADIVIGTLSSIFAPVNNLGLVIIDEEEDASYKQDQVPHYNVREAAYMRTKLEGAKLILGSTFPSVESFYLMKRNKIKYILMLQKEYFPEIKIIDMESQYFMKNKDKILSGYLHDSIMASLNSKEKILLFINRKGFATVAYCHNCGAHLKCPRCNVNLVYHFHTNTLNCHFCNLKTDSPKICPSCNSGYIKFSGVGFEKIESEISRLFPQAKIKRLDTFADTDIIDADICIATSAVIKHKDYKFGLVGVLSIDNSLNRIDFRSSEKTFGLLIGLLSLTEKKLIIQTRVPSHYCFQALMKNDVNIFYDEELRLRKQLNFPPYKHMALVKLRGKDADKVKQAANSLFEKLNKANSGKIIKIVSVNPAQQFKLRGNFYWQVLASSSDVKKLNKFLKINLKDFSCSGIIVTVDVDPL
jgi:primosomal protein N' (replication factor Y)